MAALTSLTLGQALLASAAIGAGASMYSANQAAKDQAGAADRARREAEQAQRRANPNRPAPATLLGENTQAPAGGSLLTGPTGVNPDELLLGRSTLLGR